MDKMFNPHITAERRRNPQYAGALHIFDKLGRGHAQIVERGIDASSLLSASETWSSSERIMMRIALDLFNPRVVQACGYAPTTFGEAVDVLDTQNLHTVIEAMQIACGVSPAHFSRT
jgi:hypothetical protein